MNKGLMEYFMKSISTSYYYRIYFGALYISNKATIAKIKFGIQAPNIGSKLPLVANAPEYGKKTKQQNAKILFRSLISFRQRFPRVQWCFAGSRSMAELYAYWFFFRFYEKEFLKPKSILDEV